VKSTARLLFGGAVDDRGGKPEEGGGIQVSGRWDMLETLESYHASCYKKGQSGGKRPEGGQLNSDSHHGNRQRRSKERNR